MKAIWNNEIIAESSTTLVVEGKHYFPQHTVNLDYLLPNEDCVDCPSQEFVNYYDLHVGEKRQSNAAWFYPNPKENVSITGYIGFRSDIKITQ